MFIGVPALLVLIAAFLVVMPVVDNPQVSRREQQVDCHDDGSLKCGFKAEVDLHIRTYFAMIFHNHNWMTAEMAARVLGCGK